MKKHLTFILAAICTVNLFAYDGAVSGHKKLMVHQTEWFDVIYAKENEATARILIANADRIYKEVSAQYGITPQCRMPLVITQKVEAFNAYWTSSPYNHIVVFDTGVMESMQVSEDALLSTFWHEITHSVTYNMKNDFWTAFDKVFGDPIYPGSVTISRGMAEGAAVASESLNGEGRLNDEFSRQMVKQAKIEGKFPYFSDVQGAGDKYPTASFYNFNGEFYQWVQKKYGLEKFANFWYRLINLQSISVSGAFKKAFGQSLRSAWKEFEKDLTVPVATEAKNPVAEGTSKDFFEPDSKKYSKKNNAGAIYSNLKKCDEGLIFTDEKTNSLYFVENAKLTEPKIKAKKLFTLNALGDTDISSDGRFISTLYYSALATTQKSKLKIYDRKSGLFTNFTEFTNIHGATIIKAEDGYHLVLQHYDSPTYHILTYKINLSDNGKKITSFTKNADVTLPYGTMVQSFSNSAHNEGFTAIVKSGLKYLICNYSLNAEEIFQSALPEELTSARYLSYNKESALYYFSCTLKDSMPRIAVYSPEYKIYSVSQKDYSGGIYFPVYKGKKLYYIGNFYRQNRILTLTSKTEPKFDTEENPAENQFAKVECAAYEGELLEKPYNRFNFFRGILVPYSLCTSTSYNYANKSSYPLPIGTTYITSNPWTSALLTMSAGYGMSTNSAAIQATYQSGTFTNLFKYQLEGNCEFDADGWKQANGQVTLNSTIPFGRISYLVLSDSLLLHYGRSNLNLKAAEEKAKTKFIGYAKSEDSKKYFYGANGVSAGYTNIHQAGDGKFSTGGFSLSTTFITRYNANNPRDLDKYEFCSDLGFTGGIAIPRLLPLHDSLNLTYNLPTKIKLHILTEDGKSIYNFQENWKPSDFPEFNGANVDVETILFGVDIQKGAGILFFNDFCTTFHYKVGFSYSEFDDDDNWRINQLGDYLKKLGDDVPVEQYFGIKITAGITPNYGLAANSQYKTDCYFEAGIATRKNSSHSYAALGVSMRL